MNEQSDHIVSSFDDDIASIRMSVIEPTGEKNTTTHNTPGKEKISFEEVLKKSKEILL